jgi:WD40-like Beta Propeller Repeat
MPRRPRSGMRAAAIAAVLFASLAPAAHADIFAVTGVPSPVVGNGRDIALVDVNTGARLSLPSGVNTTADEQRPSITTDGDRMVFLRFDAGTEHVIMVDLSSGQTSDLFNGFEVAAHAPRSPSITPDGKTVFTGGEFRDEGGGHFRPYVTATDVTGFPVGPYPHTDYNQEFTTNQNGFVEDVFAKGSAVGDRIAFQARLGAVGQIALDTLTAAHGLHGDFRSAPSPATMAHPSVGSPDGALTVLFDEIGGANESMRDIRFLLGDLNSFVNGPRTALPVDSPQDESRPAFTPDDRYVVFIQRRSDGHDHLFAWDIGTQLLVNNAGVDLGPGANGDAAGSPGLYIKPVFTLATVSPAALVNFKLITPSSVGIIVQRVVGHHRLFGRKVPTLKLVGRVPFGHFKKGHSKVHWNLRVKGKRLPKGTYQITPRALTKSQKVRDLGTPKILHVK